MDKSEEATLQLHDAIIDLYLNVKIRHTEEVIPLFNRSDK